MKGREFCALWLSFIRCTGARAEFGRRALFRRALGAGRRSSRRPRSVGLARAASGGAGQAQGLAFSVPAGFKLPPSLRNIYKELEAALAVDIAMDGDLSEWAQRGVLLLNTTLTVREKEPASHAARGWEELTDIIIKSLSDKAENIVFVLWGAHAHAKKSLVDSDRHLILEAPHPSPFSAHRGFFGSKPFSKTNKYLASVAKVPIDWTLTDRQGSLF